jgi:hypothetical protein
MLNFTVPDSADLNRPITDKVPRWLTTADAARMLQVTRHGVRWLVRQGKLACERMTSGQMIFRHSEVVRLVDVRATARLSRVPAVDSPITAPRQLSLFGTARLRLIRREKSESVLRDRVANAADFFRKTGRVP